MKSRYKYIGIFTVIFIFCLTTFMASMVEARRGGGGRGGGGRGGGFSRGGPAAGGGFSSRSTGRQPTRQAPRQETRQQPRDRDRDRGDRDEAREDWQQHGNEAREDRQQQRNAAREDRQDFIEDEWDDHHHHHYYGGAAFVTGVAVGAAASSNYLYSVPCRTTFTVSNVIYYHCGSTWYSRGYEGGQVVYIVTSAPAGY